MKTKFNIVELFSGIGSQAKAFERLSVRKNVEWIDYYKVLIP